MQRVDPRIGFAAAVLSAVGLLACSAPSATSVQVSEATLTEPAVETVVIAPNPPPPTRAEIPPPAPSPQALWRFGHWSWNGTQFVWNPGQYVERPFPAASWIPGYWEQRPEGWIRVDGQWTS